MSDGIQGQAFDRGRGFLVQECMVEGCNRKPYARSLCSSHYKKMRRAGKPLGPSNVLPWEERLANGFDLTEDGCWQWQASLGADGYGRIQIAKVSHRAHRLMWEYVVGPIPEGLQIDHLCRNRACVNPDHLEPVTQRQNILRGESPSARHAIKTHCPQGHAYSVDNTYVSPAGQRFCRTCRRASWAS